eukprot:gene3734-3995_t
MQSAIRNLLAGIGDDPFREGLLDTPKRVAKAMVEMLSGYSKTADSVIGEALFTEELLTSDGGSSRQPGIVLVRDIQFAALSADTLMPFHGKAHVAYLPSNGTVLGLSKLARLVHIFSKRLQRQADLQHDLLHTLMSSVSAAGAMVVIEARQLTFAQPQQPLCVTAAVAGSFAATGSPVPSEVLAMLGMSSSMQDICCLSETQPPPSGLVNILEDSSAATPAISSLDGDSVDMCLVIREEDEAITPLPLKASNHGRQPAAATTGFCVVQDTCCADIHGLAAEVVTLLQEAGRVVGVELDQTQMQMAAHHYAVSLTAATSGLRCLLPQQLPELLSRRSLMMSDFSHVNDDTAAPQGLRSHESSLAAGSVIKSTAHLMQFEEHLPFVSQCEHHLLPFYGSLHINYCLPSTGENERASTAAKPLTNELLASIVTSFTQRLQLQERICQQVAEAVEVLTGAAGVMIVARATHMCMVARGIQNHGGSTVSTAVRGCYVGSHALRIKCLHSARMQQDGEAQAMPGCGGCC